MVQGTSDWKEKMIDAIQQGKLQDIYQFLDAQSTSHAGTANAQVKNAAIKEFQRAYGTNSAGLLQIALEFCHSENLTAQEIGAQLLAACYPTDPVTVERVLRDLADRANWEVREWAAAACGRALSENFDHFYPLLAAWAKDASENVRRAVLLAVMVPAQSRNPAIAARILDVVESLLSDHTKYVRENLGPFALGSALIKYYPHEVIDRLRHWVKSEDEQIRWNVAMVFSAAAGADFAQDASDVLRILYADERPYVKRAVTKAMDNIRKRHPKVFDQIHADRRAQ